MTTRLEQLDLIRMKETVYAILFRRTGVAIQFYNPPSGMKDFGPGVAPTAGWERFLVVHRYYETLEAAIQGEYERIFP